MHGVGSCHPNIVEPLIGAPERSQVRDIPVSQDGSGLLQVDGLPRGEQVNADKAVSCIAHFHLSVEGHGEHHVTYGMVVSCRIGLQVDL